ncbi:MAG: YchF/TatD family DNA exonuclease [Deltaproteobacteria bacterium]|nr:YchF/TatD family DNA exonuclease [Deltaproteobacteria bacterium]
MTLVDTHAHLTDAALRRDLRSVLGRARSAGVGKVVTVGTDLADSRAAVELADAEEGLWAAVGVHPHDASQATEATLDELSTLAKSSPKVVAWGEIGLDFYRDRSPRPAQRDAFRAQVVRAKEAGLPVIVHDREAHQETLAILKGEKGGDLRGVFHCFSGDVSFAREVLALGFYLSIPGTVTYPKNEELRRVVASVPLERCLLETDCPYLAPQPLRGKTNEPAYLVHTARAVAELRGVSVADVARITSRASLRLFGVGEAETPRIAYPIRRSLYLNVTARCTNRCGFCAGRSSREMAGHDLSLEREPTVEEILAAVRAEGGPEAWEEVVFCGLGESLLRLEDVIRVARALKAQGARRIRVNTDGLASLVHGRDVVPELVGAVDAVSVSLNAPDAHTYERLCRPTAEGAYEAVLAFLRSAARTLPEVTASAVTVPGLDVEACRRVAEAQGARFRAREYDDRG